MPKIGRSEYLKAIKTINLYVDQLESENPRHFTKDITKSPITLGELNITPRGANALEMIAISTFPNIKRIDIKDIAAHSFKSLTRKKLMTYRQLGKRTAIDIQAAFLRAGIVIKDS